ncbi:threonine synthase [Puccinia graminis f. sp. tritici CRL 75-36-700-3]|uniref:threonine synthase n=1 Tax=Puccinia graminis f. sp. tritici (strain CRL 75-36-700-3 / race SCCL) TaxID=418459 RepID=E3JVX0_PUCGT|nr:threonine synthase [Puccinia graminis f. sp. tritici CRL 75-36-700-3]EFP76195.1 threonine synthase [Puccinia graminis f. sp. tritici CRL 75-36-700-3]
MEYISTRGGGESLTFEQTVLSGLAPDGGLYIPKRIPELPKDWESRWSQLSFTELALEIYSLFIPSEEITRAELKELIERSYSTFRHPAIAPLKKLTPSRYVVELWHGPTFAFKDVALQFLGNLFEFFLNRKNLNRPKDSPAERITVVGATSGDTGSAAIYGLRGKNDISIFILHPKGRVSPIQEAQMTTVLDDNVFNLAVNGTFDDCQDIVKTLFNDTEFNSTYRLGAINSINWARILAQIVYYFSSYYALRHTLKPKQALQFVVPTGNFGDILAGFYAHKLGLPIGINGTTPGLVIATNSNDILTRFWETGKYEKQASTDDEQSSPNHTTVQTAPVVGSSDGKQASDPKHGFVKETLSPAMDILVSSNFERLLFYLAFDTLTESKDPEEERIKSSQAKVKEWMSQLKSTGRFRVPESTLQAARALFSAGRVDDEQTKQTIRRYFNADKDVLEDGQRYVVDPHTAVGLFVAENLKPGGQEEVLQAILSTAHPAKFAEAVTQSILTQQASSDHPPSSFDFERDVLPVQFIGLLDKPRRVIDVHGIEIQLTKDVIISHSNALISPSSNLDPTTSV